jgi:ribonuclease HI
VTTRCRAWTDGGCRPNPGNGGWAAVLIAVTADGKEHRRELSGAVYNYTNNLAELRAIFEVFKAVKVGTEIEVLTDSELAIGWLSQGWKRKDPQCAELLGHIDGIVKEKALRVTWTKVRGHAGDPNNERCDLLCQQAIAQSQGAS